MGDLQKPFDKLREELQTTIFREQEISKNLLRGVKEKAGSKPRPAKKFNPVRLAMAASLIVVALGVSLLTIPVQGATGEVTTGWHYVTEGAHRLLAGWLTPGDTNQKEEIGWLDPTTYFVDSKGTRTQQLTYKDSFSSSGSTEVTMEVQVGTRDSRNVLFTKPSRTPEVLVPSPDLKNYAFLSVGGNLWVIDSSSLKLKQLVGDRVGEYDRKSILEKISIPGADTYQPHLYWAMDPKWSPDGKYIAYTSNRDLQQKSQKGSRQIGMELWLVNTKTGVNKLIFQDAHRALHLLGWNKKGQVLVRTASNEAGGIVAVNITTGKATTLKEGSLVFDRVSPEGSKAVFFKINEQRIVETATPYLLDLKSGREYSLPSAKPESYNAEMLFSPSGDKLFAIRQDMAGNQEILILNTDKSGQVQSFEPPKGEIVYQNMCSWVSGNKLLIITSPKSVPEKYNTWVLSVK